MYVADINAYLPLSSEATTGKSFTGEVQFASTDNAGLGVNESYLPDARLMIVCFFIAVLVFFLLVSSGYVLFYYWKDREESLYASDTDTTISRGRTPPNPKEIRNEPAPPNNQIDEPPSDESGFRSVVTGIESILRSIVARFFKKKATECGDVWHTGVDQAVPQVPFINIDVVALQNALPLRSLDDTDF